MNIKNKLASATNANKQDANKKIAKELAEKNNKEAIKELVALLGDNDKKIQSDAIKVLYEISYLKPNLIATYHDSFIDLLASKNNRLVWGGMIALSRLSKIKPMKIFKNLTEIQKAIDKGSVITKDAGVQIYANLAIVEKIKTKVIPLLFNLLESCPDKQLAQYVEKSKVAIDKESKKEFLKMINVRLKTIEKESIIKRIKKVCREVDND